MADLAELGDELADALNVCGRTHGATVCNGEPVREFEQVVHIDAARAAQR